MENKKPFRARLWDKKEKKFIYPLHDFDRRFVITLTGEIGEFDEKYQQYNTVNDRYEIEIIQGGFADKKKQKHNLPN